MTKLNLFFFSVFLIFAFCAHSQAQIIYKIPDGVFPIDMNKNGFKGMLFLEKDAPSGLFVAFPNEGESHDSLRERLAKFIAPMVVGDTKNKDTIPFEVKNIASQKEDVSDRGRHYFYKGEKDSVQIIFFERKTPASNLMYGYFAKKGNDETKSKIWVNDDLKMPKLFTKFVKTFSSK